ncbi:MAG: hypothetical protein QOJ16_635 [Acidobacteriota bacterium]|jgi:hypothetical protein|nr:hypothetical protein [Acidobacteriota bacterium]
MKKAIFCFLAVALLVSTALPILAEQPAPTAAPTAAPAWLAGLAPAADASLGFLPQPILVTACSFPDRTACTQDCRQQCSPCHSGGGTCTLEAGCVCGECLCK